MSLVIAHKTKQGVFVSSDKALSNDVHTLNAKHGKIVQYGPYTVGLVGCPRFLSRLVGHPSILDPLDKVSAESPFVKAQDIPRASDWAEIGKEHEHIAGAFLRNLRSNLKDTMEDGDTQQVIVVFRDKIFLIEDFEWAIEVEGGFYAVGTGAPYAVGAYEALRHKHHAMNDVDAVHRLFYGVATKHCPSVSYEHVVVRAK